MKKLERIVPEQIEELRKRIGNRVVMVGADIVRQLFREIDYLRGVIRELREHGTDSCPSHPVFRAASNAETDRLCGGPEKGGGAG